MGASGLPHSAAEAVATRTAAKEIIDFIDFKECFQSNLINQFKGVP